MNNRAELIAWAESLQSDYDTIGERESDVTFHSFADSAKDFIDCFLLANGGNEEDK